MPVFTASYHELRQEAYEKAKRVLTENRDKLDTIAHRLIEVETLDAAQFAAFFDDDQDGEKMVMPGTPLPVKDARERPSELDRDRPSPKLDSPPRPAPA